MLKQIKIVVGLALDPSSLCKYPLTTRLNFSVVKLRAFTDNYGTDYEINRICSNSEKFSSDLKSYN